jgi:heptosyltransferase-2
MKILVRGTNWIGDAVMAIPAMRRLRQSFPGAEITLHTRSWAEGILRDADFIDQLLTFDKTSSKIKDVVRESRALREKNFDIAVLLPNSFESALVAKLAGIPKRFGYAKDGRSLLLTSAVKVPEWKNMLHEVFYYMNLVSALENDQHAAPSGLIGPPPEPDLRVSEERRRAAREKLRGLGVGPVNKTIALGVGSTNSRAKRWPAERYAALNDRIQEELGADVVLVGGPAELDISQEVFDASRVKPVVLTGQTDLAEAVAILAEVDLLISNDMGLAHIAPAVGTKTLVIFGPTNPETTRPFSNDAVIIREGVDCSPCMLRDCPIDHRCMTRISVDEVFEKAKASLEPSLSPVAESDR